MLLHENRATTMSDNTNGNDKIRFCNDNNASSLRSEELCEEKRIEALEDKFRAWSTRLQRLERSSPLEERVRDLEEALERLLASSDNAAAEGIKRRSTATNSTTTTDSHSALLPFGSFTNHLRFAVSEALSFASRSMDTFFGAVLRLGSDGLRKTLHHSMLLRNRNTSTILLAPANHRSKTTPTNRCRRSNDDRCKDDGTSKHSTTTTTTTNLTFCLKPGMDGYSQSLDIESCGCGESGSSSTPLLSERQKVSALHREAVRLGLDSYIDPATGYDVFSAHHLKSRECCGSSCRHCPWGHRNVPGKKNKKKRTKPTTTAIKISPPPETTTDNGQEQQLSKDDDDNTNNINSVLLPQEETETTPKTNETEPLTISKCHPSVQQTTKTVVAASPDNLPLKKSRLYTRKGDTGWGELYSGQTIPKSDPVYDAIGDVDELNSAIGLAIQLLLFSTTTNDCGGAPPSTKQHTTTVVLPAREELPERLEQTQAWLLDLASVLCTPRTTNSRKLQRTSVSSFPRYVRELERWIDESDARLSRLQNFILPGGSPGASALHLARAICRRAERRVWFLIKQQQQPSGSGGQQQQVDSELGVGLNRLSDFLFVAARLEAHSSGAGDARYGIDRKSGDRWQRRILR